MALTDPLTRAEFYSPDVWGTPYGNGHRGFDIERAASRPVPHLLPGTVIWRGRGSEIGGGVVTDRGAAYAGRGRYIGYAHVVGGSGNDLGHVAGYGEDHGTKWTAPHVHTVVSDYADALYNAARPTYDPAPFITAALGLAGGSGGTNTGEDDMATPEEIAHAVWTYNLTNKIDENGQPAPDSVTGRASDWITNLSDLVAARLAQYTAPGAQPIDYAAFVAEMKAQGVFDLTISGTARPDLTRK